MEKKNNPYFNVNITYIKVGYNYSVDKKLQSFLDINYTLETISRLDGHWKLTKNKNLNLVGTFESFFLKEVRNEKLKKLGI